MKTVQKGMKKPLWVWITVGALVLLGTGFVAGAFLGFRQTLLYFVRRDVRLYGPGHDDYLYLGKYGSKEDIPSLLYGLKQQTNSQDCTYGHCVDALRALSGANPGDTYREWTNWWGIEMKQPVPDWHPAFGGVVAWKRVIQQDSAANGSQPIRSETNRTSTGIR
ncbi:MAG: hypothetical protein ACLQU4_06440 [Limisphaerales bacterium]